MTQPSHGETARTSSPAARTSSIAAAEEPDFDFIDAPPPTGQLEWPPVGSYPGEPGHPDPAAQAPSGTQPDASLQPGASLQPDASFQPDADTTVVGMPGGMPGGEPPAAETEVLVGEPVWHQPPPAGPFHARHEKPGEWRTEPPEHLALEHSPPAAVEPGVQHDEPTEAIPLSMLPHSWEVPFDPHATETVVLDRPPRHKRPFWVVTALILTLLIFGGGTVSAYLLLRDAESGKGAPDPATAVNRFMTAVYTVQDAATAGDTVCREARDAQRLTGRIDQIKGYANEYDAPSFRWNDPAVSNQTAERATVGVQLTMITDDEKTAYQQLTFTVVRKTGWLVCDVSG